MYGWVTGSSIAALKGGAQSFDPEEGFRWCNGKVSFEASCGPTVDAICEG